MSLDDIVQRLIETLSEDNAPRSYGEIASKSGSRKAIVKEILRAGKGQIFLLVEDTWKVKSGISSSEIEQFKCKHKLAIEKIIEESDQKYALKKRNKQNNKMRNLLKHVKDAGVGRSSEGVYDPYKVAYAQPSNPFHYGKKKTFTGAIDGAYATSNVPAGGLRVLAVSRKAIKSSIGSGLKIPPPTQREATYADFQKREVEQVEITVTGVRELLKNLRRLGTVSSKSEIPADFSSGMSHVVMIKSKHGEIKAMYRASDHFHHNQEVKLKLEYIDIEK